MGISVGRSPGSLMVSSPPIAGSFLPSSLGMWLSELFTIQWAVATSSTSCSPQPQGGVPSIGAVPLELEVV